ncbi:ATP-binding cassette sub- A member 5, partial [Borealophlyctis nickersoniae]
MMSTGNLTVQSFPTESDLETHYARNPTALFAGLIFSPSSSPFPTTYTIRMNSSQIPKTTTPNDAIPCRSTSQFRPDCSTDQYIFSGFLGLQDAVDGAIISLLAGNTSYAISTLTQQLPLPAAELSPTGTSEGAGTQTAIYLVIALSPFMTSLLFNIVTEKEKKIKEGMFMMGLRPVVFWLAWAVAYAMILIVATVIIAVVVHFANILPNTNLLLLIILFYSFTLSLVAVAFTLTTFFSKAKMATVLGPFLTIVPAVLFIPIKSATLSPGLHILLSMLLPPMGLSLALDKTVTLENATPAVGLQFSNLVSSTVHANLVGIVLAIPFYFIVAVYLDAVLPSEY